MNLISKNGLPASLFVNMSTQQQGDMFFQTAFPWHDQN